MGRVSTVRMVRGFALLLPLSAGMGACSVDGEGEAGVEAAQAPDLPISQDVLLASVMAGMPPGGVTQADLPEPDSLGAELVARYCGVCHGISQPSAHSATDWPAVVRRMWMRTDRVAESAGITSPDAAERIMMLRYLLKHALQVSEATLPEGRGRDAFVEQCSQCHALPDPSTHSRDDWAAVVLRMKARMETMLGKTLLQDQIADLVFYLQTVSEAAGP